MKLSKVNSIFFVAITFFGIFAMPQITRVVAISQDQIIEDIDFDDIGAEGHYSFANVTYTTDGTGVDVLDGGSSAGIGASVSSSESVAYFGGKLHTRLGFGVYVDKPEMVSARFSSGGVGSSVGGPQLWTYDYMKTLFASPSGGIGASVSKTNETTDNELFEYAAKERYDTGKHKFTEDFDDETTWYDANVSTAANAFNLSSEYHTLNESLTDASEVPIDDYFNNEGDNIESGYSYEAQHIQGETFVVGYEDDMEEGVIEDLRAYLALLNGKDLSDIVIQDYNISSVKISFNISEDLTSQMRDAADYYLDNNPSSAGIGAGVMITVPDFLNDIGKTLKHGSISFGTKLKQFGKNTRDWLSGTFTHAKKEASKAFNTAGGFLKSCLSNAAKTAGKAKNFIVDIGQGAIKTGQRIVQKGLNVVKSIGTGIFKLLTSPIFLIALIAVAGLAIWFIMQRREKM